MREEGKESFGSTNKPRDKNFEKIPVLLRFQHALIREQ